MDSATLFKLINELIVSIASLLWPIVTLVIVLVFRRDLAALLARVRKGKLFGQEVELDPAVKEFRQTVEEAQQEIPEPIAGDEKLEQKLEEQDRDSREVLDAAAKDPQLGIMKLSSILEREVRLLAGSLGQLKSGSRIPATRLFLVLVEKGYLPKHTTESLKIFWELRNQIVHGQVSTDARNILRVLDIGLVLLKTIQSIPHEINVIHHTGVELFTDKQCTQKLEGVKGVILETTSPGRAEVSKRIFPTKNASYFKNGKRVTWEWNLSYVWGQTWYVDPDDGLKKKAWDSSGEFVGRHPEDI